MLSRLQCTVLSREEAEVNSLLSLYPCCRILVPQSSPPPGGGGARWGFDTKTFIVVKGHRSGVEKD